MVWWPAAAPPGMRTCRAAQQQHLPHWPLAEGVPTASNRPVVVWGVCRVIRRRVTRSALPSSCPLHKHLCTAVLAEPWLPHARLCRKLALEAPPLQIALNVQIVTSSGSGVKESRGRAAVRSCCRAQCRAASARACHHANAVRRTPASRVIFTNTAQGQGSGAGAQVWWWAASWWGQRAKQWQAAASNRAQQSASLAGPPAEGGLFAICCGPAAGQAQADARMTSK